MTRREARLIAAKAMEVPVKRVVQAEYVLRHAPDLFEKVKSGHYSLRRARWLAGMRRAEQRAAVNGGAAVHAPAQQSR